MVFGVVAAVLMGLAGYLIGVYGSPAELKEEILGKLNKYVPVVREFVLSLPYKAERAYTIVMREVGMLRSFMVLFLVLTIIAFAIELLIKPMIANFQRLGRLMGFSKGKPVNAPAPAPDTQPVQPEGKMRKSQQKIVEERAVANYIKEQQRKLARIEKLEEQLRAAQGKAGMFKGKSNKVGRQVRKERERKPASDPSDSD